MKNTFLLSLVSASLLIFFSACRHDAVTAPGPEVSFSRDIQPIIIGNCTASRCHSSQGGHDAGALTTYDEVMRNGDIKAGKPEDSDLFEEVDRGSMPEAAPRLSQKNIELIRYWIIQGAKNN